MYLPWFVGLIVLLKRRFEAFENGLQKSVMLVYTYTGMILYI